MMTSYPDVVVLGGPNGAGKSTAAPRLLRGTLAVEEFVNADTLAQGLSAFRPEDVAIEAGRATLERLDALEHQRNSFAFESTLSSHGLVRRLQRMKAHRAACFGQRECVSSKRGRCRREISNHESARTDG